MTNTQTDNKWYAIGDLNAFFALFLDNVVNLVILSGILTGVFAFPKDIIFTRMIPGTALGVMVGDLLYSWMAIRIQKKEGGKPLTAMPLGLDTPSTIGIALVVLGPAFMFFKETLGANVPGLAPEKQALLIHQAGMYTWYLGSATLIWMGGIKLIFSFIGDTIQKLVPVAGLLGSLAGIGMVWLSADSLVKVFHHPIVGLAALAIITVTLIAQLRLPYNLPGAAAAVIFGSSIYYFFHFTGFEVIPATALPSTQDFALSVPYLNYHAFEFLFNKNTLNYLPIALPFGLITIIGGINICVAARIAGDNYSTRKILLTESFATFIAGVFGGVSQSTPYIGHGAYKAMGARSAYTIATGITIGIGGSLGLISFIVGLIPEAAVAPILIFVGFEIAVSAYQATEKRFMVATTFAIIPSVVSYGYVKANLVINDVLAYMRTEINQAFSKMGGSLDGQMLELKTALLKSASHPISNTNFLQNTFPYIEALGQGYIITAMLWGAGVSFLIDRKLQRAALSFVFAAVFSFFGIIHSATATGEVYIPWTKFDHLLHSIPLQFAIGYLIVAGLIYSLKIMENVTGRKQDDFIEHASEEIASLAEKSVKSS